MRIGIDVSTARLRAAIVDADSVVWTGTIEQPRTLAAGCRDLLRLLDADTRSSLEGATLALVPAERDLDLEHVGLLRISSLAAPSLSPLSGWPDRLAVRLAGRTREIPGGATFLGTDSVAPDDGAVLAAIEELTDAGAAHIVVAAAGALADPSIERRVERVIRAAAPRVQVSLAHLLGGMGLRERENGAVLEAALIPWAVRLAREVSEPFGRIPVSIARGVGGRVVLEYFSVHPFGAIDGRRRAAVEGARALSGADDLVVILADEDEVATIGVTAGRLGRPDVSQAWGVPHNHQPIDARIRRRAAGHDSVPLDADTPAVLLRRPGHSIVVVGDAPDGTGLPGGEMAVAIGAAGAEVNVETERIVTSTPDKLATAIEAIIQETRSRAIVAGDDPSRPATVAIEAVPVSYVPEGTRSVRVSVGGGRSE